MSAECTTLVSLKWAAAVNVQYGRPACLFGQRSETSRRKALREHVQNEGPAVLVLAPHLIIRLTGVMERHLRRIP